MDIGQMYRERSFMEHQRVLEEDLDPHAVG
jgi:hypothetical protein